MIDAWFVLDLLISKMARNSYGDLEPNSATTIKGWLIEHAGVVLNNAEETQESDAICWLPPTADIDTDSLVTYDGVNYRPLKIIKAKRGMTTEVIFKKCYLEIARGFEGIS